MSSVDGDAYGLGVHLGLASYQIATANQAAFNLVTNALRGAERIAGRLNSAGVALNTGAVSGLISRYVNAGGFQSHIMQRFHPQVEGLRGD